MMRACHLNTCPVGIATQDPELRKRFKGTPEHVINFFFFVAEEARAIMASLGIRTIDELIGRTDLLVADDAIAHWKARGIDLGHVLHFNELPEGTARCRCAPRSAVLDDALDWEIIRDARPAHRARAGRSTLAYGIRNVNRCVGGLLSAEIARAPRGGRAPGRRHLVTLRGSAGQSFGGWLAPGVSFTLHGDANDYTGKGLSGGVLAVRLPEGSPFRAEENVVIGNTVLYGGTSRPRVLPRPGRRALRRAQLRRPRGGGGRRRPRLRVHDRRARGRARPHRAQLRGGHERRHRLRARRGRRLRRALQHGAGRASTRSPSGTPPSCAASSRSTTTAPARRSRSGVLADWEEAAPALREGHAPRLQAGAGRARRAGRRDEHSVSTSGDGFVTAETETELA